MLSCVLRASLEFRFCLRYYYVHVDRAASPRIRPTKLFRSTTSRTIIQEHLPLQIATVRAQT